MDNVPLKISHGASFEIRDDVEIVSPDYILILQETQYDFSLEKWVLTGLQNGFSRQHQPFRTSMSEVMVSCPPYWMSLQQNRLTTQQSLDILDPNRQQQSHSLNPEVLCINACNSKNEAIKPISICNKVEMTNVCELANKKAPKAFVPDLHNPPSCLSSLPHQRRKNLRQYSLVLVRSEDDGQNSHALHRSRNRRSKTIDKILSIEEQKWSQLIYGEADATVELLSVLSPEERELVGVITSSGYPIHTAIAALQKTACKTPEQILSYVTACEHLCQQGHDVTLVEEALEIFQNCETKAAEFLQLLSQFNEMGFHQNIIKEVLLVNGNHRERALEELMIRLA